MGSNPNPVWTKIVIKLSYFMGVIGVYCISFIVYCIILGCQAIGSHRQRVPSQRFVKLLTIIQVTIIIVFYLSQLHILGCQA